MGGCFASSLYPIYAYAFAHDYTYAYARARMLYESHGLCLLSCLW